ncbi:probable BOI-related E3 ubiquitin-protein ligase 3 [Zingiber officinale]|uniref:probable BOI-related E3 ubiquitin-protein ligase 3 n=1 Tax=Zingiber officinale TaxID=94328 RepID=UPI001C4D0578|nr:probable BOI-related E3 ubiquitin-protein ligase 3 [Zingiber officinale]
MAMQAQQQLPSNFSSFPAEFGGGAAMEELLMVEELRRLLGVRDNVAVGLSDPPRSELTGNGSGTRAKRAREEEPTSSHLDGGSQFLGDASSEAAGFRSLYTSTSGRPAEAPLSQDLATLLCQQNTEIDALLRLETERMRSGLEEARKRHYRALIWGVERRAAKRLREKEAELEKARRRNAELEEWVRQASTERQAWLSVAEKSEAVAASLRASLDQVLLQNAAAARAKEGYGDTEEEEVEDAQSTSPERYRAAFPDASRKWCRSCRREEASVLLLPCRHLCSCRDCEAEIRTCPVCGSDKNASLQVSTS